MYAFISNEYKGIVHTQRQLDFLMSIYSYPKFAKVKDVNEARQFFKQNNREFIFANINKYGKDSDIGYIRISYLIDNNPIYVNVDTSHFGFIKLDEIPNNVKQEATYDLLKLKISNVVLDNELISHHCVAITNILSLFDKYIHIELVLPDISVYLAITKYTGTDYSIKRAQSVCKNRLGKVFYTIQ